MNLSQCQIRNTLFSPFIDSGQPMYDYCAPNPCHNGGKCSYGNTGYTCHCLTGSYGSRCEHAIQHTTERSTNALLTTTHRSTQMIPTATSKPCMDDTFFNCQNPVICQSEFRNNCPLSCGICETTQGTIARGAVQHTCNKIGLLMDLAMGKSLHQQSAKGCGGNSSDAVVIKHCQAPSFSKWRKGFEVTSNCSHINHYTPVAEWDSQGFTDNIGVITFCHSGVIEMITQTCGGNILLRNITTPASKSFYTVDWV
ncbi:NOTCH1 [Mytilus edulis]|uniref:NOTCH1 n=1 Tax=Mytilus edulis TaxID=6550 RepID=A0A8S3SSY8_MYTED|nr:NOTCH1 [Mytilus edulis]